MSRLGNGGAVTGLDPEEETSRLAWTSLPDEAGMAISRGRATWRMAARPSGFLQRNTLHPCASYRGVGLRRSEDVAQGNAGNVIRTFDPLLDLQAQGLTERGRAERKVPVAIQKDATEMSVRNYGRSNAHG